MIKALVIDDSAYNRVTISRILESHPDIRVVATAVNGEDGLKQVLRHNPDVVTLDLEMPVMDGFAFLRWIVANRPTAVIAVSSKASDRSVFKALELGAVDFVVKPGGRVSPRLAEIERDLVEKVLAVSSLRIDNLKRRVDEEASQPAETLQPAIGPAGNVDLVVIGSSTGGPPALQHLFQTLPRLAVPFIVAQHMPPTFTRLFAERVNKLSNFEVREAEHGEPVRAGHVYIAPGGMQTVVERSGDNLTLAVSSPRAGEIYAPSVDRLFDSASTVAGDRLVGVILTGMGDDGARGIRRIRDRGGRTIAESEETAIIFGMPGEAIRTGGVESVLPLRDIPHAIQRLCSGDRP